MMVAVKDTTMFGGKPYPVWQNSEMELPGYKNAALQFKNNKTNKIVNVGFLISPTGFQEQRTTMQQTNRTMAGWFIQRNGSNLSTLNLSGYMLDTRNIYERLNFLDRYLTYVQDVRNNKFEYVNDWETTLFVEGRKYSGFLQSLNLSKSGNQQFLYQYGLTFISYSDVKIYHTSGTYEKVATDALDIMGGSKTQNSSKEYQQTMDEATSITNGLYGILTGE